MYFIRLSLLFQTILLINANIYTEHSAIIFEYSSRRMNELGLTFGHHVHECDNTVTIYFDVSNSTLNKYQYYYFDFHSFGSLNSSVLLPRQRLLETHNSLQIIGLQRDNYISCLSFIDKYETLFEPRYGCHEFVLNDITTNFQDESQLNYLVPLLFSVAFILHVIIVVCDYIKSKNYQEKIFNRFIQLKSRSTERKLNFIQSLRALSIEFNHPYIPTAVQHRLSHVSIDVDNERESNCLANSANTDPNYELSFSPISHHSKTTTFMNIQVVPKDDSINAIKSTSFIKTSLHSNPLTKHVNQRTSSSSRLKNQFCF